MGNADGTRVNVAGFVCCARGKPKEVEEIRISETMQMETFSLAEANGLWEQAEGRIAVKRDQLRSLSDYAGTLLHEVAHANSGASDIGGEFELQLTSLIGTIVSKNLEKSRPRP